MGDNYDFGDRYERNAQEPQKGTWTRIGIFELGGKDVKFYRPSFDAESKSNINRLDIVPYEITTNNHPLVSKGSWKIGQKDYMLEVYVHRSIGPDYATVICPRETYGKKCPICDKMFEAYKAGDKKTGNLLRAKRRSIYNVISRNRDADDEIMIWDAPYTWSEERIIAAKAMEEDVSGKKVNFAHPTEGNTIAFNATLSDLQPANAKEPVIEPKEYRFLPRDNSLIPFVSKAYPLDAMLKVSSYDELEALLYASASDEPDDNDTSSVEESASQKESAPSKEDMPECPYGRKFGVDTDCYAECDTCSSKNRDIWKACDRANRK